MKRYILSGFLRLIIGLVAALMVMPAEQAFCDEIVSDSVSVGEVHESPQATNEDIEIDDTSEDKTLLETQQTSENDTAFNNEQSIEISTDSPQTIELKESSKILSSEEPDDTEKQSSELNRSGVGVETKIPDSNDSSTGGFVARMYRVVLNREPESAVFPMPVLPISKRLYETGKSLENSLHLFRLSFITS